MVKGQKAPDERLENNLIRLRRDLLLINNLRRIILFPLSNSTIAHLISREDQLFLTRPSRLRFSCYREN